MTNKSGLVQQFGVELDEDIARVVHLGLRINKKRAHLLVSNILGKHIPIDPRMAELTGRILASKVIRHHLDTHHQVFRNQNEDAMLSFESMIMEASRFVLDNATKNPWDIGNTYDLRLNRFFEMPHLFSPFGGLLSSLNMPDFATIGFAETATGLGANVASALNAPYIHSTRDFDESNILLSFEEEHSHATSHALKGNTSFASVAHNEPLVLVDDEFSTGKTLINIIRELHKKFNNKHYYIVSLVDCRNSENRQKMDDLAHELGCEITPISLVSGAVQVPENLTEICEAIERVNPVTDNEIKSSDNFHIIELDMGEDCSIENGLQSNNPTVQHKVMNALPWSVSHGLKSVLGSNYIVSPRNTLMLGREEFMYYPQLIAHEIDASFSSSTRSPVIIIDDPEYPIRNGVSYVASDGVSRYAYNVANFENVVIIQDYNMLDEDMLKLAQNLTYCVKNVIIFKLTNLK